jgi:ribonuclease P protein component
VERRFRLTRSEDFKRVRRSGRSYAHPLIVLVAIPNDDQALRVGIAAGRSVGNAVKRNRSKRLIRASMHAMLGEINSGWDLVILARQPVCTATYLQTKEALHSLLKRARLIKVENGSQ